MLTLTCGGHCHVTAGAHWTHNSTRLGHTPAWLTPTPHAIICFGCILTKRQRWRRLRGLTKEDWLGLIPDMGNGVLSRRKETNLNHNASKKLNRKTVTSSLRSETEQKPTPRPSRRTDVRSSPWYEKAAKSIAVSARLSQSFSRDGD
jgi:hypothetical protein